MVAGTTGWSMPVCEIDLKVGGAFDTYGVTPAGREMGMGGLYRAITPQQRIVCTELYDDAWYPGEALTTTTLVERRGRNHFDDGNPLCIKRGSRQSLDVRHGARRRRKLRSPRGDLGIVGSCADEEKAAAVRRKAAKDALSYAPISEEYALVA